MRKLAKGLINVALAVLCIATVLAVIGAGMGGDAQQAMRLASVQTENGNGFGYLVGLDSIDHLGQTTDAAAVPAEDTGFVATDANNFIVNGAAHTITQLQIDMEGVKTTKIVLGDAFGVSGDNLAQKLEVSANEGQLTIQTKSGYKWNNNKDTITITLPKNATYDLVCINAGAGSMKLDDLTAQTLTLGVGAGSIDAKNLTANDLTLTADAGSLKAKTLSADTLTLTADAGSIKVGTATATENADVHAGAGSVTLDALSSAAVSVTVQAGNVKLKQLAADTVDFAADAGGIEANGSIATNAALSASLGSMKLKLEEPDDYGWSVDCGLGNCKIGSEKYSGMDIQAAYNEDAATFYDISCQMGSVTIDFA